MVAVLMLHLGRSFVSQTKLVPLDRGQEKDRIILHMANPDVLGSDARDMGSLRPQITTGVSRLIIALAMIIMG